MSKTVLMIDDSAPVRQMMALALRSAGYEVLEASDGQDALTKLEGQKVKLVVCDLNMPNMDGVAFLNAFKQLPDHRFTPVIMLTADASEDRKAEVQSAGVKLWMEKPFRADGVRQFVSTVERMGIA